MSYRLCHTLVWKVFNYLLDCKDSHPGCPGWQSICKTHQHIASLCKRTCKLCQIMIQIQSISTLNLSFTTLWFLRQDISYPANLANFQKPDILLPCKSVIRYYRGLKETEGVNRKRRMDTKTLACAFINQRPLLVTCTYLYGIH